jgi:hypothetical protein
MEIIFWLSQYWFWFTGVAFIAIAIVQIVFAVAVYKDAKDIANSGKKVIFAPSPIWLLATLFGGVFVAATYWLIHHSTLNPNNLVRKKTTDEFE